MNWKLFLSLTVIALFGCVEKPAPFEDPDSVIAPVDVLADRPGLDSTLGEYQGQPDETSLPPGNECKDDNDTDWDGCTNGWVTESLVNTHTPLDQRRPAVAGLPDGGYVVVWQSCPVDFYDYEGASQDGTGCGIYGQRFGSKSQALGAEFRVNTTVLNHQWQPRVDAFAEGFVVAWSGWTEAGGWRVYAQMFDSGGEKLAGEVMVSDSESNDETGPDVAAFDGYSFVVVWEGHGPLGGILGQSLVLAEPGGALIEDVGSIVEIKTSFTADQGGPKAASFGADTYVTVWEAFTDFGDDTGMECFGRVLHLDGEDAADELVVNADLVGGQYYPAVATLTGDAGFVVAYRSDQANAGYGGVLLRSFDWAGQATSGEHPVNPQPESNDYPDVAVLQDGRIAVAWNRQAGDDDPDPEDVYLQVFGTDFSKVVDAVRLNTYGAGSQGQVGIAGLEDGGLIAVWESCPWHERVENVLESQDETGCGVYSLRFDSQMKKYGLK